MKALTTADDLTASRPFDISRSGFVVSEGMHHWIEEQFARVSGPLLILDYGVTYICCFACDGVLAANLPPILGGAAMILESEEHAIKRNVKRIYAEVAGYCLSGTATLLYRLTAFVQMCLSVIKHYLCLFSFGSLWACP